MSLPVLAIFKRMSSDLSSSLLTSLHGVSSPPAPKQISTTTGSMIQENNAEEPRGQLVAHGVARTEYLRFSVLSNAGSKMP
ncbi:unnamed protein product [Brassica oleracea var. botrytis]|uniref:(rape) hypothetical protein n=1 Tax=Brassica napus TaxID=3708 RepID=A0A816HWF1_BRANA|nr:unnamed protein product [Brassica napus]